MIVRRDDLRVIPWADRVLVDAQGRPVSDIDRGRITWSNELTAHVIELKTSEPESTVDDLAAAFATEAAEINARLAPLGAQLLPTAMHPAMVPDEAVLWAHEFSEVYQTFDRIFDCRGHGWSNLQSVHLNLPFADDAEFARLHAAIRLVLPLLPALAASSPMVEGRLTGLADNRLAYYRRNSAQLPPLTGQVIPEPVYSRKDYEEQVFAPIAQVLAPHDPDGVLEPEFTNSRGAIARFSRQSIEIRLLDVQECPAADLAMIRTVVALLRELVAERHLSLAEQQAAPVAPLAAVLQACVERGSEAVVAEGWLRRAFGVTGGPCRARDLWRATIERLDPGAGASPAEQAALAVLAEHGTLAERLQRALQSADWRAVYREIGDGLTANRPFIGR